MIAPDADQHAVRSINEAALEVLRDLVSQRCGRPVTVLPPPNLNLRLSGGGSPDATRNQAYKAAAADPLVRELQRRFEAEIVAREPSPRTRFLADLHGENPGSQPAQD